MATVKDLVAGKGKFVSTITGDKTVLDAAKQMNAERVGALVVVDGGSVVGMISERDLLTRVMVAEMDPGKTLVGNVMTKRVAYCKPGNDLDECKQVMTVKRIRHLPVIDNKQLVGIVTIGDLMAREVEEQKKTIEYLNQYIAGDWT